MVNPKATDEKSIADLLHGEYTNQTNIHYKLTPVIEAVRLRCKAARVVVEDRYIDGEQVTLHCRIVSDGRGSPQETVVSVPVSLIDARDDTALADYFAAQAALTLSN